MSWRNGFKVGSENVGTASSGNGPGHAPHCFHDRPGYYLVHVPSKGGAHKVHETFDSALTEAKRLAQQQPGVTAYIMASIRAVTVDLPEPRVQMMLDADQH